MNGNKFNLKACVDSAITKFKKFGLGGEPVSLKSHHDQYTGEYQINIEFENNSKIVRLSPVSDDLITVTVRDYNTKNYKVMLLSTVYGDIGCHILLAMVVSFDAINSEFMIQNAQCKLRYGSLSTKHSVLLAGGTAYHIASHLDDVYVTDIRNGKNPVTVAFRGKDHDELDLINFMNIVKFTTSVLNDVVDLPEITSVTTDIDDYTLTMVIRHAAYKDTLTIVVSRSDEDRKNYLFTSVFKDKVVSQCGNHTVFPISQLLVDTVGGTFGLTCAYINPYC